MKGVIKYFSFIYILFLFSTNCSYIVDSIEAGITERSSFSIEGDYDAQSGLINLSWESGRVGSGDEAFAGYEIYITDQPDNEFVGYVIITAPYNIGQDYLDRSLRRTSTASISIDPEPLDLKGVYFFRVGIINWDKDSKEERAGEDDDDEETTGWRPYNNSHYFYEYDESNFDENDDNLWFYVNKTGLDSISGSLMVDIER